MSTDGAALLLQVIVDNNTWNNTHIATVGRAMASPEKKAWKIYRYLDVEYVFVVFGALIGYPRFAASAVVQRPSRTAKHSTWVMIV